jgi:lipopolysaccharide exporter
LREKWLPIAPLIQILSISGLFLSIGASAGPLLYGMGKPNIITRLLALRLATVIVLIYPLTSRLGIQGAALALLVSTIVVEPLEVYMAMRCCGSRFVQIAEGLMVPTVITLISVAAFFLIKNVLPANFSFSVFSLMAVMYVCLYGSLVYLACKITSYSTVHDIRRMVTGVAD